MLRGQRARRGQSRGVVEKDLAEYETLRFAVAQKRARWMSELRRSELRGHDPDAEACQYSCGLLRLAAENLHVGVRDWRGGLVSQGGTTDQFLSDTHVSLCADGGNVIQNYWLAEARRFREAHVSGNDGLKDLIT